jgi:type III restriction enzyme
MTQYEVPEPIINSPFEEPGQHWYIREGEQPELRPGRRPAIVYPPRDQTQAWDLSDGALHPSPEYRPGYEMVLVNLIRQRVAAWRAAGWPGVTRTTLELLQYWRRDGRDQKKRLFFTQLEAAETVVLLTEARADFHQGIAVPVDEPNEQQRAEGARAFIRCACKMATGAGKTTVMGMLAAWSILNKVNDRGDGRFSDVVLIVCPNTTIRNRLQELDPRNGEASLYRTRDLVPPHMMPLLTQGRVLVTNWHIFEPQAVQVGGTSAKVAKVGRPVVTREAITIAPKTTTARGSRYLTQQDFDRQVAAGMLTVLEEERDKDGALRKVRVESVRYVESDTRWIERVVGREVGGKQNILVMNDEAHHAYRIRREEEDPDEGERLGEREEEEEFFQEATVWVDGLDRIHKMRGINFCVDLSATPYFLGRVGQDTNKPFPWVVSDFGLIDSIESGLVKIPQLAVRDTTGAAIPGYFNVWDWILPKLTPAERGGRKGSPKPEAILKWAHTPIAMLGGLWEEEFARWEREQPHDPRRPVFILVCKNTAIAKVIYEWLAEGACPSRIPPANIEKARNRDGQVNTIRADTKVVRETDTDGAKSDEDRWMRLTLNTVSKTAWPADSQGRPIYPEGFEELAGKLGRPLHPPGRDVRCIVSVGMLTEGWDCCTVTHIIGLRPFMSQLLCEQVVGRGLRRADYDPGDDGMMREEVSKVFGVPFEIIPFKANPEGPRQEPPKRWHVHAVPAKAQYRIEFPRVEGYTQAIRNRVTVDWDKVPPLFINPLQIPPDVQVKALSLTNEGRRSLLGPGRIDDVTLENARKGLRLQQVAFDVAAGLTQHYVRQRGCEVPPHRLFPQMVTVCMKYLQDRVHVEYPGQKIDVHFSPYYGWLVERLVEAIRPDTSAGEVPEVPVYESHRGPGSTDDVDFWTRREPREAVHCHLNYIVPDTERWEQSAAYYIDKHPATAAFVKNAGLGFAIPYFHNGQSHDYEPDFIVRLTTESTQPLRHVIVETKGYDPLRDVKRAAAERWVAAVNTDGRYGYWQYALVNDPARVVGLLDGASVGNGVGTAGIGDGP